MLLIDPCCSTKSPLRIFRISDTTSPSYMNDILRNKIDITPIYSKIVSTEFEQYKVIKSFINNHKCKIVVDGMIGLEANYIASRFKNVYKLIIRKKEYELIKL